MPSFFLVFSDFSRFTEICTYAMALLNHSPAFLGLHQTSSTASLSSPFFTPLRSTSVSHSTKLSSPFRALTARAKVSSVLDSSSSPSSSSDYINPFSSQFSSQPLVLDALGTATTGAVVQPRAARQKVPPLMPLVMAPGGPVDLISAFFRNRIIFLGSMVNSQTAQQVISQLIALSTINPNEDIKMYINSPGGSTYSIMAVYDAMSWVKADVSTVALGMCASHSTLLLAGGTKGKRFAMPNTRIMIHQPQGGCGGMPEDVRYQVNEVMSSRDKMDKMFATFTGQPLERIQRFTERDYFFSAAEAMEFGLIDGVLETEY